jgi:hypothetical protein
VCVHNVTITSILILHYIHTLTQHCLLQEADRNRRLDEITFALADTYRLRRHLRLGISSLLQQVKRQKRKRAIMKTLVSNHSSSPLVVGTHRQRVGGGGGGEMSATLVYADESEEDTFIFTDSSEGSQRRHYHGTTSMSHRRTLLDTQIPHTVTSSAYDQNRHHRGLHYDDNFKSPSIMKHQIHTLNNKKSPRPFPPTSSTTSPQFRRDSVLSTMNKKSIMKYHTAEIMDNTTKQQHSSLVFSQYHKRQRLKYALRRLHRFAVEKVVDKFHTKNRNFKLRRYFWLKSKVKLHVHDKATFHHFINNPKLLYSEDTADPCDTYWLRLMDDDDSSSNHRKQSSEKLNMSKRDKEKDAICWRAWLLWKPLVGELFIR